jgi:Domain of unknown function (DUF397)
MTAHAHVMAPGIEGASWFKSSYSSGPRQCVEVADLTATAYRAVAVRDSKDPTGPALLISPAAFADFVAFAGTFSV